MEFGTLADWMAALAAVGALAVGALGWSTANRLGKREDERLRRRQAEQVSSWFAAEIRDPSPIYGVMVSNSSTNLIYDIEVEAKSKYDTGYPPLRLTCLPPGTHWIPWNGKEWDFPVDSTVVSNELRPVARSGKLGIKRLQFRDASDSLWTREEQGALRQLAA